MKIKGLHLAFLLIGIGFYWNVNAQVKVDSLVFAPFGKVHLYIPLGKPSSVTIMISGDGDGNMESSISLNISPKK